ncbi:MAG: hypothetical protein HGB17_03275 [Syntrophobacteraceae bacterium]|nr:hypothetical protein [Syntrophobacteraceae bacterium]
MGKTNETLVMNLGDDRIIQYDLPPEKAVVAAYEQFEKGNLDVQNHPDPEEHPAFKVYKLGVNCGDWIAFFQTTLKSFEGPQAHPEPAG